MDRRVPEPPRIVPTKEEAAKLNLPAELLSALENVVKGQKPRRATPVVKTRVEAFLPPSEGAPGSRGSRTTPSARRRSQRRTRGRETWMAKAKAKHKAERQKG